jgi:predicted N-acetyltransferase YhbS
MEGLVIGHLFETPEHARAVAEMIHNEFWADVPGASIERMQRRLQTADGAGRLPICRVALLGGVPVGTVNLVENDDEDHVQWLPWLAGMVVAGPWRGRGIGSALVQTLLADAARLGFERVYLGTDAPPFYQRLGAVVQHQLRPDFWFMRFDIGG